MMAGVRSEIAELSMTEGHVTEEYVFASDANSVWVCDRNRQAQSSTHVMAGRFWVGRWVWGGGVRSLSSRGGRLFAGWRVMM